MDINLLIFAVLLMILIVKLIHLSLQKAIHKDLVRKKIVVSKEFYDASVEIADALVSSNSNEECNRRMALAASRIKNELNKENEKAVGMITVR